MVTLPRISGADVPRSLLSGDGSGSEAGLYLRLIDSCITQLKDQGPFRTCGESKEEEVMAEVLYDQDYALGEQD